MGAPAVKLAFWPLKRRADTPTPDLSPQGGEALRSPPATVNTIRPQRAGRRDEIASPMPMRRVSATLSLIVVQRPR